MHLFGQICSKAISKACWVQWVAEKGITVGTQSDYPPQGAYSLAQNLRLTLQPAYSDVTPQPSALYRPSQTALWLLQGVTPAKLNQYTHINNIFM